MMSNFKLIQNFLSNLYKVNEDQISTDTRIFEDLGIDGKDGVDLITKFNSEFNVNMDEFRNEDYFAPEGIDVIGAVSSYFKTDKKKLKILYVHRLIKAMDVGFWKEDEY